MRSRLIGILKKIFGFPEIAQAKNESSAFHGTHDAAPKQEQESSQSPKTKRKKIKTFKTKVAGVT